MSGSDETFETDNGEYRFSFRIRWGLRQTELAEALDLTQARVLDEFENELRSRAPVRMRDSIRRTKSQVIIDNSGAQAVEYGSKPHWVPIAQLREWATHIGKDDDPGAAYRIQRAISERGTHAHPFVRPSLDALRIEQALQAGLNDLFGVRGL
jgi:hypothetical protein